MLDNMTDRQRFESTAAAVERDLARLGGRMPLAAADRDLFLEEIHRSTAVAGSRLGPDEVRALVERDVVAAGRSLAENELVADYGDAARLVRRAAPSRRRAFVALDEVANLHATAVRRAAGGRPGRWRESTVQAFPSGMVPPPAWLVPREIAAFIERFGPGPPAGTPVLLWVAEAHARFLRIHPFDSANGRVARLLVNLLLRRSGLPPFVVRRRDEGRYLAALRRADSRDPWPLAQVVAASVLESFGTLLAAPGLADGAAADGALAPLATFASGAERAALYKAAQRGRLRVVSRGGALLTARAWIDAYRARHRASARELRGDGDDPGDARPL
jgi:hypothetical protein